MNVPDDLLYTESHEWIRREGENVRVGITDHAQAELTDVVFVEVPKAGRQAKAKEAVAVVESVKAASDIYAPVAGTIVEGNKGAGSQSRLNQYRSIRRRLDFSAENRGPGKSEKPKRSRRLSRPDELSLAPAFPRHNARALPCRWGPQNIRNLRVSW